MLAQILQTDDVSAVQQWLVGAGDREKAMVLDLIRQAMEAKQVQDQNMGPQVEQQEDLLDIKGYTEWKVYWENFQVVL